MSDFLKVPFFHKGAIQNFLRMKTSILLPFFCIVAMHTLAQNVGIGITSPLATLDVARGTAFNGTAMFRGTSHASSFNYGTNEDTYIRGGKNFSNVIINDENFGKVGIGVNVPAAPLHIVALQDEILRLQGAGPYISFYDITTPTGYLQGYGNDLLMGTFAGNTLGALRFYNNNVVNMSILANGRIGMGTTTPQARLNIAQDNEALRLTGNQAYISFYNGNEAKGYLSSQGINNMVLGTFGNNDGEIYLAKNGVAALTVQGDGRVRVGPVGCNAYIGNHQPRFSTFGSLGIKKHWGDNGGEWAWQYSETIGGSSGFEDDLVLFFNGGVKGRFDNTDGDYSSISDIRLKEDFEPYKTVLDGVKNLDVMTYHYKTDNTGKKSFGLVAQNLQQYFPELVGGNEQSGGYLGIAYAKTGVLAIKAIQEQQVIIDAQQKRIEALEAKLETLANKH